MKKTNLLARLVAVSAILFSTLGFAGNNSETDANGVILAGYDAVAYFTENAAVEGKEKFTAVHNDAIFRFSSAANRDTFSANPSKYAPQFGGFCAYGAALGKKFEIDGKAFEVVAGKLYVNKNLDVYEVWVEDKSDNIDEANKQWTSIANIPAGDL